MKKSVSISARWFVVFAAVCSAVLLASGMLVQARDDGRLNESHHFGGDVLYCVTDAGIPTTTFFDINLDGGFQLLNINGQPLWFVPAEDVVAAIAEAKSLSQTVLVAEGTGTYGPVSLYVFIGENDTPFFIFNGFDEYGKPNSFTFQFCNPVGGDGSDDSDDDGGLCSQSEANSAEQEDEFLICYRLACPGIPLEEGEKCYCTQYPNSPQCNFQG